MLFPSAQIVHVYYIPPCVQFTIMYLQCISISCFLAHKLYMCTIYHLVYCVVYYVPAMYKIMLFPSTQIVHDPLHASFPVDHGELLVELEL